jgi:hypothetical protein
MSSAQAILIIGGLVHFLISLLAAYFIYWERVRHPEKPAQHYGLFSHKVSLWNGFLLFGLAVAIEYTNYTAMINTLLAAMALISTLLSDVSNIRRWMVGMEDQFVQGPEWRIRAIGLVHILDLVVISGILIGVTRSALGI